MEILQPKEKEPSPDDPFMVYENKKEPSSRMILSVLVEAEGLEPTASAM